MGSVVDKLHINKLHLSVKCIESFFQPVRGYVNFAEPFVNMGKTCRRCIFVPRKILPIQQQLLRFFNLAVTRFGRDDGKHNKKSKRLKDPQKVSEDAISLVGKPAWAASAFMWSLSVCL